MEQHYLSFLYPSRESEEAARLASVRISAEVIGELGLASLLPLRDGSLSAFFTASPEVIAYRQEVFRDLADHPELSATLQAALPLLLRSAAHFWIPAHPLV